VATFRPINVCACVLTLSMTAPAARGEQFTGGISATWTDPVGGGVEGVGTGAVRFTGADPIGELKFTAAGPFSAGPQPFQLGRVDFTAGGLQPSQLTFRVGLDTATTGGAAGTAVFSPRVAIDEFSEPGYRELQVIFDRTAHSTATLGGKAYTLGFAGLTNSTTWDPTFGDRLIGVVGEPTSTGYLWATLDPAPDKVGSPIPVPGPVETPPPVRGPVETPEPGTGGTSTEGGGQDVPGVPEPATWILAGIGLAGLGVVRRLTKVSGAA
jgi:PEP-CTERM motif